MVSGIGQIRRSQGKKTWMAFLDFRKAFPSVWRDLEGLWEKMKIHDRRKVSEIMSRFV